MKPKGVPEMRAEEVIKLVKLCEENQLKVTLDGGWGVDALLGEQTRPHADLDIVIWHEDVKQLRALLERRGYTDVPRPDTREYNFVMGDAQGHLVDIHTYSFDPVGHPEWGLDYPLNSLKGTGSINGHPVRSIALEYMVQFHTGYALDEDDYHDVKALCERFGIQIPAEYDAFVGKK